MTGHLVPMVVGRPEPCVPMPDVVAQPEGNRRNGCKDGGKDRGRLHGTSLVTVLILPERVS